MSAPAHSVGSSVTTSAITAFVALWPSHETVVAYVGKLIGVLVLAMVAELGRRIVSSLWRKP